MQCILQQYSRQSLNACVCVRVPSRMSSAALYRAGILKSMRLFIDYEETLYASLTKGVRIVDISPIHPQEIIVDDKDSTHIMTLKREIHGWK